MTDGPDLLAVYISVNPSSSHQSHNNPAISTSGPNHLLFLLLYRERKEWWVEYSIKKVCCMKLEYWRWKTRLLNTQGPFMLEKFYASQEAGKIRFSPKPGSEVHNASVIRILLLHCVDLHLRKYPVDCDSWVFSSELSPLKGPRDDAIILVRQAPIIPFPLPGICEMF